LEKYMQKKIIALAVAGLVSGAAFAQSNVTVYGIVDTNVDHLTTSGDLTASGNLSRTNVSGSGLYTNRIGFKGSEDLGGGMKANFFIESNLGTDAPAATTLGDRLMTIGLSGKFGSVNLGRQYTPYFNVLAAGDTFAYAGRGSANNVLGAAAAGTAAASIQGTVRQSNSIRWDSPNWNGFQAAVLWSAGAENQNTATKPYSEGMGLSVKYANGPLAVGYAVDRVNATAVQTAAVGDQNRNALTASYNFGMATVVGGYATSKQGDTSSVSSNAATFIGVRVPVSAAGLVRVQWAKNDDKLATNIDSNFWSIGYAHSMSKRTTAYVNYGSFDLKTNAAGRPDWRALQAGIAHTF
jgi:predicted porin